MKTSENETIEGMKNGFKHLHHVKHGLTGTPTYESWKALMTRCFNPNHPAFKKYRNLRPCEFIKASPLHVIMLIGERPSKAHTIDRKKNKNGYHCGDCPECQANGWEFNLRWATKKEQGRNRDNNCLVEIDGVKKTLPEWSEIKGIPTPTLRRHYVRDYYYDPVK